MWKAPYTHVQSLLQWLRCTMLNQRTEINHKRSLNPAHCFGPSTVPRTVATPKGLNTSNHMHSMTYRHTHTVTQTQTHTHRHTAAHAHTLTHTYTHTHTHTTDESSTWHYPRAHLPSIASSARSSLPYTFAALSLQWQTGVDPTWQVCRCLRCIRPQEPPGRLPPFGQGCCAWPVPSWHKGPQGRLWGTDNFQWLFTCLFVGGQFLKVWGRSNLRKNRLQTIGNITRITSMHT